MAKNNPILNAAEDLVEKKPLQYAGNKVYEAIHAIQETAEPPEGAENYISGGCGLFAVALARAYGYKLGIWNDVESGEDYVAHIYAINDQGKPVDVTGVWPSEEKMAEDIHGIWGTYSDEYSFDELNGEQAVKDINDDIMVCKWDEKLLRELVAYVKNHPEVYGPKAKYNQSLNLIETNKPDRKDDNPMVFIAYHGSPYGKFDKFDMNMSGAVGASVLKAFFFSSSREASVSYSNSDVDLETPESLKARAKYQQDYQDFVADLKNHNPDNWMKDPEFVERRASHRKNAPDPVKGMSPAPWIYKVRLTMHNPKIWDAKSMEKETENEAASRVIPILARQAKDEGYDGVVFKDVQDTHDGKTIKSDVYAVFNDKIEILESYSLKGR